jgi:hypothetical protein
MVTIRVYNKNGGEYWSCLVINRLKNECVCWIARWLGCAGLRWGANLVDNWWYLGLN